MSPSQDGYFSDGYSSGAKLLASDARIVLLLLREARDRACERLFGVSKEDSALITLIALAMLGRAIQTRLGDAVDATPSIGLGEGVLGMGAMRAAVYRIGGEPAQEVPGVPLLVTIAFLAYAMRPVLREVRAVSHRMRVDFNRRYGHLLPERRHARRTYNRMATSTTPPTASTVAAAVSHITSGEDSSS